MSEQPVVTSVINGETLTPLEQRVTFFALMAQVRDVHAPVWSLDEQELECAGGLLRRLQEREPTDALTRVVIKALLYVDDQVGDHLLMSEDEGLASDAWLTSLESRYGR